MTCRIRIALLTTSRNCQSVLEFAPSLPAAAASARVVGDGLGGGFGAFGAGGDGAFDGGSGAFGGGGFDDGAFGGGAFDGGGECGWGGGGGGGGGGAFGGDEACLGDESDGDGWTSVSRTFALGGIARAAVWMHDEVCV